MPNGEGWKKAGDNKTWDFQNESTITGVYIQKKEEVGENKSNMYMIRLPNGEVKGVWGGALLDDRFSGISIGEEVQIEYLGKVPSEKRKGASYHNFELYHREVPMQRVGGMSDIENLSQ